jgi:hypothetical protein
LGRLERALYRVLNAAVRLVLRSPLHGLVGGRILLLTLGVARAGGRSRCRQATLATGTA